MTHGARGKAIEDVKKLAQLLTPHLARNSRIQSRVLASLGRYVALSQAVSRLPDAYFALGPHGTIVDHNPAALEILKGSADALAVRNGHLVGVSPVGLARLEAADAAVEASLAAIAGNLERPLGEVAGAVDSLHDALKATVAEDQVVRKT